MRLPICSLSALALIAANGCADTVFCWETNTCRRLDSGTDSLQHADAADGAVSEASSSTSIALTNSTAAANSSMRPATTSSAAAHASATSPTVHATKDGGSLADSSLPPVASADTSIEPDATDDTGADAGTNSVNTCPNTTGAERVCTAECPCAAGEGVCALSADCQAGLDCVPEGGIKYGFASDATCLPLHCDNDTQDEDELSVDCGGECGCLATFEIIQMTGLPADADSADLKAMSGDGAAFAAYIARGVQSYPATVSGDGVITELESYGDGGTTVAMTKDGRSAFGMMSCNDPPACDDYRHTGCSWANGESPTAATAPERELIGVSSTGSVVVGNYYDAGLGQTVGFRYSNNRETQIPGFQWVFGVSPDGLNVVGLRSDNFDQAAIWSVKTSEFADICPESWTGCVVWAINGTSPTVVVGHGYISENSDVGFLWKDGVLTDLGVLDGGRFTNASGVSEDGSVVVGGTGDDFQQAFIWRPEMGIRSILEEVRSRGIELPADTQLAKADFLSDDGTVIVGRYGGGSNSFWRAVLLR